MSIEKQQIRIGELEQKQIKIDVQGSQIEEQGKQIKKLEDAIYKLVFPDIIKS